MRILGIITARSGSKGVPGKNSKILGDIPLVAYTYAAAMQASKLTKVILSSDDEKCIAIAKEYGVEVPFIRPETLATDSASSIAVVQHAIAFLEAEREYFDAVCLLQPTSPFREKDAIDNAITLFLEKQTDALVSVLPVPHEYNPHWVFQPNEEGNLTIATGESEIIKRRQDLPKAYFRDGSIYITRTDVIKQGSFFGKSLSFVESNPEWYVNIDTPYDWIIAEQKLSQFKKQN